MHGHLSSKVGNSVCIKLVTKIERKKKLSKKKKKGEKKKSHETMKHQSQRNPNKSHKA